MTVYSSSLCPKSIFFVTATDILSPGLDIIGKRTWRIYPEVLEFAAFDVIFDTVTYWSIFYLYVWKRCKNTSFVYSNVVLYIKVLAIR
jgi:hypothetical protein